MDALRRNRATVLLAVGGAAAAACAVLTVRLGWGWLWPMLGSLLLATCPAGWVLLERRVRLGRMLAQVPSRRYRSPRRRGEPIQIEALESDRGEAGLCRPLPARRLGALADRLGLAASADDVRPAVLRARIRDLPLLPAVPVVILGEGKTRTAILWRGPGGLLVAEMGLRDDQDAEAAFDCVLEVAERAEARRGEDLAAIGELDACPAGPSAELLAEAGYERLPDAPLACVSDLLTLCELEFAWPPEAEFRIEPFEAFDPARGTGLVGLHAEGARPVRGGWATVDLILVRETEAEIAVFLRRDVETE